MKNRIRKPQLTPEQKAQAVSLYKEGLTYREVAKQLKTNHMTIARAVRAAGVDTDRAKRRAKKRKRDRVKALEMIDSGMDLEKVAKKIGWSFTTVYDWDRGLP